MEELKTNKYATIASRQHAWYTSKNGTQIHVAAIVYKITSKGLDKAEKIIFSYKKLNETKNLCTKFKALPWTMISSIVGILTLFYMIYSD